jgi:hypothetical protein
MDELEIIFLLAPGTESASMSPTHPPVLMITINVVQTV